MVGKLEAEINLMNKLMRADSHHLDKQLSIEQVSDLNGGFKALD